MRVLAQPRAPIGLSRGVSEKWRAPRNRRPGRLLLWLSLLLVSAPVVAGPVLHERFSPDPAEDLRLGATTPSGKMPATIETRSGLVSAPDEGQPTPDTSDSAYGGGRTPTSADASYHIDRLTTRPERVSYDEPFRPSVLPFKRLYAFDRLKDDLSFGVLDHELSRVSVGGLVEKSEDAFFADFEVDLVAGVPVRIPSVGPGAKIRALHVDPPQEVQVLEDSAENWFARADRGGRARMVLQLSIEREVFGSQFLPVSWEALAPHAPPLVESAREVAREVAEHVGVSRRDPPARAMMTLVDYFRRFEASSDLPRSTDAAGLYRELSFEQKGVCRHRAYAFAITALSLGLPTRVVHNEAHAWVEVFDTEIWHRIDLGGAASDIQESRLDPLSPNHRPPNDPYTWPAGATSGLDLAPHRSPPPTPASDPALGSSPQQDDPDHPPASDPSGWPSADRSTNGSDIDAFGWTSDARSPPELKFSINEKKLLRGHPLLVSGTAMKDGAPCRLSRVDVFFAGPEGPVSIGSVATDREGKFQGSVTLPPTTPVGTVQLSVEVGAGCE